MRSSTLLSLLAAALVSSAAVAAAPPDVGSVYGEASATYLLEAPGAPAPPNLTLDGFTQKVEGPPGRWTVKVSVSAAALPVRQPFRPGRPPSSLGMTPELSAQLGRALAPCQRTDEAVQAVALFLRTHLKYAERVAFEETPEQVFKSGEASCVGFTRTASAILEALGIPCREVVGLKVPLRRAPVRLEGGLLHAWLEVDFKSPGRVFCDPLRSFGWVPESYIVLRMGGGLTPEELSRYSGGQVTLLEHADRLFFEPPAGRAAVLWARTPSDLFTGTLVSGKLLRELDLPASGLASLSGPGGSVSMPLWEGNYFFRDLEPGNYVLALQPDGQTPRTAPLTLRGVERRFVVSYAGADGESSPGAADEPRRKS